MKKKTIQIQPKIIRFKSLYLQIHHNHKKQKKLLHPNLKIQIIIIIKIVIKEMKITLVVVYLKEVF